MKSVKWGINNDDSGENSICAAGVGARFSGGGVKAELSWLYNINDPVRNGFLMFSISAAYL